MLQQFTNTEINVSKAEGIIINSIKLVLIPPWLRRNLVVEEQNLRDPTVEVSCFD